MSGTLALAAAEVRRLGRNKQYSVFSVALPVVLYLVVAPQTRHASAYGGGVRGVLHDRHGVDRRVQRGPDR